MYNHTGMTIRQQSGEVAAKTGKVRQYEYKLIGSGSPQAERYIILFLIFEQSVPNAHTSVS